MTRKIKVPNTDHLIERYLAGETVHELARAFNLNRKIIYRIFKENNIGVRGNRVDIPDLETILTRYLAGETEQSLALEFNLSRTVLRRRLLEAGIRPRTISDTMKTRWTNATAEERERMLTPAHETVTGKKRTVDFLERCALGRERTQKSVTATEIALAGWLRDDGIAVIQQKAVGIYNLDIAINEPPLAIEIFGGGWHKSGAHADRFHQRFKYLLDHQWSVLIIWIDTRNFPLTRACSDYIIAYLNSISLDPSRSPQYRVIRGDGQLAPASENYFNSPADKERLGRCD